MEGGRDGDKDGGRGKEREREKQGPGGGILAVKCQLLDTVREAHNGLYTVVFFFSRTCHTIFHSDH